MMFFYLRSFAAQIKVSIIDVHTFLFRKRKHTDTHSQKINKRNLLGEGMQGNRMQIDL